jgi:delta24(24(1))-sterol reductase
MTEISMPATPGAAGAHATEVPEEREFGGAKGATALIVGSHVGLYYLWYAVRFHKGAAPLPDGFEGVPAFFAAFWQAVVTYAAPTWSAAALYVGFLFAHALLSAYLPGIKIKGLPIEHLGGVRLEYNVNGHWAWYITLITVGVAHLTGVFTLDRIYDMYGPLMTVAMLCGNAVAIGVYAAAHVTKTTHRMSGNFVYDFFMGASLNPRVGRLDLKMWAEIRVAWILLFLLTLSAAGHQYAEYGAVSTPMLFMVLAHFLYTNACHKGEECIPTTWDIFYEKWGWMLIFWNFAGVPFVYAFNSMYLAARPPFEHSLPYTVFCFALLLFAYYVWDTSQSQRNRFRMQLRGTFVKRRAFPQLPWGTLENPRYLDTASGSKLLVDGWWRYARKIHYTADVAMALSWGLICGFTNFLPYFYVTFFLGMILHRTQRDIARCKRKYGSDWDRYTAQVKYLFVPGIY